MSRTPAPPPLLDGYQYLDILGSGGFADVFKYQQLRPRREVAIKVLLKGLGAQAQRQFEDEANVMALLSNHPSIVSIFAAGVAPDGRPYLVMESCQPKSLGAQIRLRPLQVGKALEVGIQVAGAVETAHRLGVLHRDIKPANILFTDFGRPALTDFGISAAGEGQGTAAFSVAWAPPEQIDNRPMGPAGDVYSLAATVWAMLVGRSPFDVPGDNNTLAITQRVKTVPPPPTGRPGVPESLERVLRTAMAKNPEQRYPSALEFARALQSIQAELHESVTTIDVREDRNDDDYVDEHESGTRVTGFALIDPDLPPEQTASKWFDVSGSTRPSQPNTTTPTGSGQQVIQHGRGYAHPTGPLEFTGPAIPEVPAEDTYLVGSPIATPEPEAPRRSSAVPLIVGLLIVVLAIGLIAAWFLSGQGAGTTGKAPTATASAKPKDPIGAVPQPTELKAVVNGTNVVFSWKNPSPLEGDTYNYRVVQVDKEAELILTTETTVTVPAMAGGTCLEVGLVRKNGQFSELSKVCP